MRFVKALIAEDDPTMRCLIAEAIEEMGLAAIECSNGRKAWEILQDNPGIGLLVADVRMPEMGGCELIRGLRGDGTLDRLAVVITSGVVQALDVEDLLAPGWIEFMAKPLSVLALQETIGRLMLPGARK